MLTIEKIVEMILVDGHSMSHVARCIKRSPSSVRGRLDTYCANSNYRVYQAGIRHKMVPIGRTSEIEARYPPKLKYLIENYKSFIKK